MASVSRQLADELKTTIEGLLAGDLMGLALGSTNVVSLFAPRFDLKKLPQDLVEFQVFPIDRELSLASRGEFEASHEVGISILGRLPIPGGSDPADPDAAEDAFSDKLIEAAEKIANLLMGVYLLGQTHVVNGSTHAPLYDRELLEVNRVCAAGIILSTRSFIERNSE